jgi:hypothetical protein
MMYFSVVAGELSAALEREEERPLLKVVVS